MLKWAVLLLMTIPAFAGGEEDERRQEIENARRRVRELVNRGEELKRAGRREEAHKHFAEAKELAAKLDAIEGKRRHRQGGDRGRAIDDLEHGIRGLRALGHHELAEKLMHILREAASDRAHKRVKKRGGDREIEMARKQLKIMRYAVEAFSRAEREDAAELMERAEHALRLRIEGRRDAEAREIHERSPKRGQLIELLAHASELYQDWGKKERAAACRWFADEMRGVEKRVRGRRVERDRDREHDRARRDDRDDHRDRDRAHGGRGGRGGRAGEPGRPHPPMERLEQLEKRLRHLERMLEELLEELEEDDDDDDDAEDRRKWKKNKKKRKAY